MQNGLKINKKTFLFSVMILFSFMILAGISSFIIPSGAYTRVWQGGRETIVPDSFAWSQAPLYPVWRWITAPIEVLWGPDSRLVTGIIVFILLIGASFALLLESRILEIILARLVKRYHGKRYFLLAIITLCCMLLGSFLGIYEEILALIPVIVAIALSMGWDALAGLGMSLLAVCFGFTAALINPFSIGVAQSLAGLPMFSGIGYRMIVFLFLYAILVFFLIQYAKKIESHPEASLLYHKEKNNFIIHALQETPETHKACLWFFLCLTILCCIVLASPFFPWVQECSLLLVGFLLLISGVGAGFWIKLPSRQILYHALQGILGLAPGIVLILMAMSVKHIIVQAGIMDTILYYSVSLIPKTNPIVSVFFIYAMTLFLNFFIGSASAKAFLIVPIIAPLSELIGLTRQTAVSAFCFGDGLSNLLYPTNAVLLIALGITGVSYRIWLQWTWKLQIIAAMISLIFLAIVATIGYGPF